MAGTRMGRFTFRGGKKDVVKVRHPHYIDKICIPGDVYFLYLLTIERLYIIHYLWIILFLKSPFLKVFNSQLSRNWYRVTRRFRSHDVPEVSESGIIGSPELLSINFLIVHVQYSRKGKFCCCFQSREKFSTVYLEGKALVDDIKVLPLSKANKIFQNLTNRTTLYNR